METISKGWLGAVLVPIRILHKGREKGLKIIAKSQEEPQKQVTISFQQLTLSDFGTSEPGDIDILDYKPDPQSRMGEHFEGVGDDGKKYWAHACRGRASAVRSAERERATWLEETKKRLDNLEKAGRFEEAACGYEGLGMYEKAGELRRMGKTQYIISTSFHMGRDGAIMIACPHCGGSQTAESKSSEIVCKYCGKTYIVAKKVLDMI